MCTSFMCGPHSGRTRRSCPSCLCMDGPAPSLSSTGSCHFSQRTRMASHLRLFVHPSLAMASQKPLTNKVDDSKRTFVCIPVPEQHLFTDTYFCTPPGFDSLATARIFLTLMERLGFSQFYLQGGDWGSLITTNMSQMKPQ